MAKSKRPEYKWREKALLLHASVNEFSSLSPRQILIVAVAILDSMLTELITQRLIDDGTGDELTKLFDPTSGYVGSTLA
jgi:hypothetical protein